MSVTLIINTDITELSNVTPMQSRGESLVINIYMAQPKRVWVFEHGRRL
jgi:hypothetical protein